MVEFKTGGLARSLAGHDKGQLYIIIGVSEEYVTLSDGNIRATDPSARTRSICRSFMCTMKTWERKWRAA